MGLRERTIVRTEQLAQAVGHSALEVFERIDAGEYAATEFGARMRECALTLFGDVPSLAAAWRDMLEL